ncbi:MAG: division/cell wall cluster transcriptional repressor MraZ [Alphaproteobacteria bacterium]|nr:division/cell wall cluster transcriptional repressor MraZ [Alphaproteobacteria bacterium]MDE2112712.1 division/cell wall cluster transcriptional repressor MraZ [Alphaproteobacteria bacterium]MDE2495254.1 division/cell wall cluster transcriptional repressor MraZ [Alphaproteobacteria bacterium]
MSAQVQPFISTVTGTLDSKGRVCIPAPYRQILAAQNTPGVYLCPSFSEATLEGFGDDVLQTFHRQQAASDPFFTPAFNDKVFAVLSMTQNLPLDENGRVRLPDDLIAHAGLKDRVVFVGMGSKFQIWEPERFEAMRAERLKRALASLSGGAS